MTMVFVYDDEMEKHENEVRIGAQMYRVNA